MQYIFLYHPFYPHHAHDWRIENDYTVWGTIYNLAVSLNFRLQQFSPGSSNVRIIEFYAGKKTKYI